MLYCSVHNQNNLIYDVFMLWVLFILLIDTVINKHFKVFAI